MLCLVAAATGQTEDSLLATMRYGCMTHLIATLAEGTVLMVAGDMMRQSFRVAARTVYCGNPRAHGNDPDAIMVHTRVP